MIYARLHGGLGNQLFQYAAGRALALRHGTVLALDPRDALRKREIFHPALHHFAVVHAGNVPLPPGRDRPLAYAAWRYLGGRPRFLRERGLGFNPGVVTAPDDTYLHGYFQSERYFADHAARIREELRIVTPPSEENRRWLDRIGETGCPVSLHVRRGDYVADPKGERTHGTCGPGYYAAALERIAGAAKTDLTVHVFSDDPAWAAAHLKLAHETRVVGHNGPEMHYEDLRLMAACRHHVIANSTFSWWGGWLDPRPDAMVAAPATWFADPAMANPDILPDTWVRVPN